MNSKNLSKKSGKEQTINNLSKIWDEYCKKGYEKMALTIPSQKVSGGMIETLISCPGGTVLDGGCGAGLYFKNILEKTKAITLIGGDFSQEMLKRAKEKIEELSDAHKKAIKLVEFDLTQKFPFEDNFFDAEIFHLSLSYLPFKLWENALKEAYRTAKPGGYVYMTTQLRNFDFGKVYKKELLRSILSTPMLFIWILKVGSVILTLNRLTDEGVITYPEEDELLEVHKRIGFDVRIAKRVYDGTVITLARKAFK